MTKLIITFNLFFVSFLSFFFLNTTEEKHEMTMCTSTFENTNLASFGVGNNITNSHFETDPNKSYTMPSLTKTPKGEIMLSWTEKDLQGITSFCLAFSKDNGKTFSEKKTIFSGTGVSNSRMMKAKVLQKKDGTLVAVFSNRGEAAPTTSGKGGRSLNIVYCVSKDGGNTWTQPASVDSDPKQGIVRGFFDAIVLSNDEIAVVYLKDVANSTKHEERDLRLVVSKNGEMQPEKLIDPVVCDCCPINMLIDANGALNIVYRDNNDDIRDMARIVSTDNAATFSKPQILHNDGWKISGCPHSGAVSSIAGKSALYAWFSGAEKNSGIRIVSADGKLLKLLDASAKNANLSSDANGAILTWEQTAENGTNSIFYTKIKDNKLTDNQVVKESINGQNANSLVVGDKVLVAYEVMAADKKTAMKVHFAE